MTLTAADFAPSPHSTLQSRYQLGETLGEGTYGKYDPFPPIVEIANSDPNHRVKQAVHLPTNNLVAIKIVLRKIAPYNQLNREIIIHQSVKHDRIIQLWETIEDKNHVYLVLELAQGGELFDKISKLAEQLIRHQAEK
jgi:serine/threonine protein kinase